MENCQREKKREDIMILPQESYTGKYEGRCMVVQGKLFHTGKLKGIFEGTVKNKWEHIR